MQINAARAEVEPMAEPRNPAHVLGVGGEIQSLKGPVFAAYFAGSRERFDAQPNYKNGLFVLVDGAVYAVRAERVTTSIRRGLTQREFTLSRGDRPQRSVEYRWPFYREPVNRGAFSERRLGDGARLRLRRPCHAVAGNDRPRAHGREHGAAAGAGRHPLRGP